MFSHRSFHGFHNAQHRYKLAFKPPEPSRASSQTATAEQEEWQAAPAQRDVPPVRRQQGPPTVLQEASETFVRSATKELASQAVSVQWGLVCAGRAVGQPRLSCHLLFLQGKVAVQGCMAAICSMQ
jgi:hypothetical protein